MGKFQNKFFWRSGGDRRRQAAGLGKGKNIRNTVFAAYGITRAFQTLYIFHCLRQKVVLSSQVFFRI